MKGVAITFKLMLEDDIYNLIEELAREQKVSTHVLTSMYIKKQVEETLMLEKLGAGKEESL